MTILAKIHNGIIELPADAPPLPEGAEVQILLPEGPASASTATAGDDFDRWIEKYAGAVDGLPEDFAAEHDHYIHGVPRRSPQP